MLREKLLLLLCAMLFITTLHAEQSVKEEMESVEGEPAKEPVKFTSKPIVTLFEEYRQGLGSESGESEYEHQRGYFGYSVKSSNGWSAQVIFDVQSKYHDEKERVYFEAVLKNASLAWSGKGFNVVGGIIKTQNYALKESAWGHRYVMACFESEYGFAPSADYGLYVSYDINKRLSADINFTNGKGYKSFDFTGNYRYGVGVTANLTDEITMRGYYDLYSDDGSGRDQMNTSLYVGYKADKFRVGAEYSYMLNYNFLDGVNVNGGSIHATYYILDDLDVFARYDRVNTNNEAIFSNVNAFIFGVEYTPIKFITLSPNFLVNQLSNQDYTSYFCLNLMVKL